MHSKKICTNKNDDTSSVQKYLEITALELLTTSFQSDIKFKPSIFDITQSEHEKTERHDVSSQHRHNKRSHSESSATASTSSSSSLKTKQVKQKPKKRITKTRSIIGYRPEIDVVKQLGDVEKHTIRVVLSMRDPQFTALLPHDIKTIEGCTFYNWMLSFCVYPPQYVTDDTPIFLRGHLDGNGNPTLAYFEYRKMMLSSPTSILISKPYQRRLLHNVVVIESEHVTHNSLDNTHQTLKLYTLMRFQSVHINRFFDVYKKCVMNTSALRVLKTMATVPKTKFELATPTFPTFKQLKSEYPTLYNLMKKSGHSQLVITKDTLLLALQLFNSVQEICMMYLFILLLDIEI